MSAQTHFNRVPYAKQETVQLQRELAQENQLTARAPARNHQSIDAAADDRWQHGAFGGKKEAVVITPRTPLSAASTPSSFKVPRTLVLTRERVVQLIRPQVCTKINLFLMPSSANKAPDLCHAREGGTADQITLCVLMCSAIPLSFTTIPKMRVRMPEIDMIALCCHKHVSFVVRSPRPALRRCQGCLCACCVRTHEQTVWPLACLTLCPCTLVHLSATHTASRTSSSLSCA